MFREFENLMYSNDEMIDIVCKNVNTMLIARNSITKEEKFEIDYNSSIAISENIGIYFTFVSKKKNLTMEKMLQSKSFQFIIIVDCLYSSNNKKHEIWPISSILHPITEHFTIPSIKIVNENVCNELHISKNDLKQISFNDPLSKYYKLKPGDIIEITRKNQICGEDIDYKIVF